MEKPAPLSHRPWKSKQPISIFPPPRLRSLISTFKNQKEPSPVCQPSSFRLILRLEMTEVHRLSEIFLPVA